MESDKSDTPRRDPKNLGELKEFAKTSCYWRGKLAMNEKRHEDMKKCFAEAIALGGPEAVSAMNDMAYYHQYAARNPTTGDGDPNKVVEYYQMAIAAGNINSCYNLGCFYHEQGDTENKVRYMMLASQGGDVRAHFGLGMHHEEHGNMELAMKFYRLAADTGNAQAHGALGDCYAIAGDYAAAKDAYLTALRGGAKEAVYQLYDLAGNVLNVDERRAMYDEIARVSADVRPPATAKQKTESVVTSDGKTDSSAHGNGSNVV